jgi:hypothetical protein
MVEVIDRVAKEAGRDPINRLAVNTSRKTCPSLPIVTPYQVLRGAELSQLVWFIQPGPFVLL